MRFASDNSGPVHSKIMAALASANEGWAMPYGNDDLTRRAADRVREVFEAPAAAVYFVATGTAANAIALATITKPWETIFCHRVAHIHEDECNGPEFYTGGAKLTLVEGHTDRMTPEALRAAIEGEGQRGVHGPQRGPVSITSVTERGTLYTLDEIRALTDVARDHDLKVHLDGARFANACAALDCTAAEMSWKAGVDVVSFGGTKNGCMGVEAVIFFDPDHAWEFELRRKRGAHLFSKSRFLAAQMDAYLTDDLWLSLARSANDSATALANRLRDIPGVSFLFEPQANMVFPVLPAAAHRRLHDAGAMYYLWDGSLEDGVDEDIGARLVVDWSCGPENIDRFIDLVRG
ncbi:MAG: low specificity L-threonine aldolase [Boseongicola sp.]|nr:low specificity L-threonine aldolase [Boseongicola sp.]